jgi:hypothetical protein
VKNKKRAQKQDACVTLALSLIDEHAKKLKAAVMQIYSRAEESPRQWSWFSSLVVHLNQKTFGFEGLRLKNSGVEKAMNAWFQRFGCTRCGSHRWRSKANHIYHTDCKTCDIEYGQHLQREIARIEKEKIGISV